MELNFTELDGTNLKNPYENYDYNTYESQSGTNFEKYWEQQNTQKEIKPKKKKVSFDDILSNMNLVVNKEGILQFIAPKNISNDNQMQQQNYNQQQQNYNQQQQQNYNQMQQQNYNQQIYNQQNYNQQNYNQYQQQVNVQNEPLDPSVKHSYIYNKYFKDYQDTYTPEPEVKVPKTMEEYRQMLLEQRIKQIQQQKRIAEIKSTKLMFTSNIGNPNNIRNMQATRNNLRMMSFK
jgi:hypothetical protein